MSGINVSRVVLGGLVAGVVLNIGEFIFNGVLFAETIEASVKELNLPPMTGSTIVWFLIAAFIFCLAMIWLYAAIRPRLGPGPKTAICAGLLAWTFGYLVPTIGFLAMGLFPRNLLIYGLVWSVFEVTIAALAGAYFYRET